MDKITYFSTLGIAAFKNIFDKKFTFSRTVNCITGANGTGKTNLLDALYVICLTKSFAGHSDIQCVPYHLDYYRIIASIYKNGQLNDVCCSYSNNTKKKIEMDGIIYDKFAAHVGKYPVVMVTPDDTDLLHDGAEVRRKFFDGVLCQTNAEYLKTLTQYNYVLKSRNLILKQCYENQRTEYRLLEPYSKRLVSLAHHIYEHRMKHINAIMPIFVQKYGSLSLHKEKVSIQYTSDLASGDFEQKFMSIATQDVAAQRTTMGIHTDDYEFSMDERPVRKTASQGQKKTYVLALKLAQYQYINIASDTKPILLLDDIFDRLDNDRVAKLVQMIQSHDFGQVFITDAVPERCTKWLGNIDGVHMIEM
ncbi:MAG: DNA replication and repair protein RecF [Cytophagales bacterium]|nr:DNA replication and repair protein RecF [Cytophagales bacterium]